MAWNKAKALQEAEKLVMQGKIALAIKAYQQILEKDPSDLLLLNTLGDLYIREKNLAEALKHFYKLAESYVKEGFTVKAIAIFKKISKIDANSPDPLLRMGELYQAQGLSREAREQYAGAFEFFKKKGQNEKALEMLGKVVHLDPGSLAPQVKLAEFAEKLGQKQAAADAYLQAGEIALRLGDEARAESALEKAAKLDGKNPKLALARARLALKKKAPAEAEKILRATAELKDDAEAKRMLFHACVDQQKLREAGELVLEVFRAKPADFTPVSSFVTACLSKGDCAAGLEPLSALADELIAAKNTAPLMESLRQIWAKSSGHIPTLELVAQVAEKSGDEFTLPEVQEALGHAYTKAGQLDKAEACFRNLASREPENPNYTSLLKQILQKQGKEFVPASPEVLSGHELALEPEVAEAAPGAVGAEDPEEAAQVKDALENSDLFARYGLSEKAVAELEKVLATYPDQIQIHTRILEISHKDLRERGVQAAEALARIYSQRGDEARASHYRQVASQLPSGRVILETPKAPKPAAPEPAPPPQAPAAAEIPAPLAPPTAEPAVPAAPAAPSEIDLSQEFAFGAAQPPASAPPQPVPFDLGSPVEQPPAAPPAPTIPAPTEEEPAAAPFEQVEPVPEISQPAEGGEAELAPPEPAPVSAEVPPFNYAETLQEIDFYLQQGFQEEAGKAVEELQAKYPGNPKVAELAHHVESFKAGAPVASAEAEVIEEAPPAPPQEASGRAAEPAVYEPAPPELRAAPAPTEAATARQPEAAGPPAIAPAPSAQPASPAGGDMLGSLAGDLSSSLEGLEVPEPPAHGAASKAGQEVTPAGAPMGGLGDLLSELGEGPQAGEEDPETHYNLGIAFREMGLLDEAIGEFQKVLRGGPKGKLPPHFLQSCTLLAGAFTEKGMPAIAAKWLTRALEAPDLDEEATLAVLYDLGVAYEQAGDVRTALQKFTEVYSQNIDYRDVAEKIRALQQKAL